MSLFLTGKNKEKIVYHHLQALQLVSLRLEREEQQNVHQHRIERNESLLNHYLQEDELNHDENFVVSDATENDKAIKQKAQQMKNQFQYEKQLKIEKQLVEDGYTASKINNIHKNLNKIRNSILRPPSLDRMAPLPKDPTPIHRSQPQKREGLLMAPTSPATHTQSIQGNHESTKEWITGGNGSGSKIAIAMVVTRSHTPWNFNAETPPLSTHLFQSLPKTRPTLSIDSSPPDPFSSRNSLTIQEI